MHQANFLHAAVHELFGEQSREVHRRGALGVEDQRETSHDSLLGLGYRTPHESLDRLGRGHHEHRLRRGGVGFHVLDHVVN